MTLTGRVFGTGQSTATTGVVGGRLVTLGATVVDRPPRCQECGRPIGEYAARPWSIRCRHCKAENRQR